MIRLPFPANVIEPRHQFRAHPQTEAVELFVCKDRSYVVIADGVEILSAERVRANSLDKSHALLFREETIRVQPRSEIHFGDGAQEKARLRHSNEDARMFLHVEGKEFLRAAPLKKALNPPLCPPAGI